MAKALVGYRPQHDPRLMLEALELRRRIADLEHLVDRLQRDNDRLKDQLVEDLRQHDLVGDDLRQHDVVGAGAPTIAG